MRNPTDKVDHDTEKPGPLPSVAALHREDEEINIAAKRDDSNFFPGSDLY